MKLSEIKKTAQCSDNLNPQAGYWKEGFDAAISALASTPDEELRLTKREQCPLFDDWYKTVQADYKSHAFDLIRATTNAQLTKVQPVITALRAKLAEAEKEKQEAVEILRDLVDPGDCDIDHHGYCQAHGWLQKGVCPHFRAKMFLGRGESLPEVKHGQ